MIASCSHLAFLGLPGGMEYIIILIVALLLFGRRLPDVMRAIGGSVREFKKGVDKGLDEDDEAKRKVETKPTDDRDELMQRESEGSKDSGRSL